jgi:hypothetical protein
MRPHNEGALKSPCADIMLTSNNYIPMIIDNKVVICYNIELTLCKPER